MRIGIDARPLSIGYGGVTRMLRSICRELERIDSENRYFLYGKRDFLLPFRSPRWQKRLHPRVPYLLSGASLRTETGKKDPQNGLDAFWATANYFPFGLPRTVAKVMMVYDLVWRLYPETM